MPSGRAIVEAFEAAREFVRGKKKLMSAAVREAFIRDIYLTSIGVRDAYMFEGFSCSEAVALDLVERLQAIFGIDKRLLILNIQTGDAIVILESVLRAKVDQIDSLGLPILIDVSGSRPLLCLEADRVALLHRSADSVGRAMQSAAAFETHSVVSLVLPEIDLSMAVAFAGWCLGYPIIYEYGCCAPGEGGCRALNMHPLLKVSLTTDCDTMTGHAFMEFSVPQSMLSYPLHYNGFEYDSLDAIVSAKLQQIWSRGEVSGAIHSNVRYTLSEFLIPHVML